MRTLDLKKHSFFPLILCFFQMLFRELDVTAPFAILVLTSLMMLPFVDTLLPKYAHIFKVFSTEYKRSFSCIHVHRFGFWCANEESDCTGSLHNSSVSSCWSSWHPEISSSSKPGQSTQENNNFTVTMMTITILFKTFFAQNVSTETHICVWEKRKKSKHQLFLFFPKFTYPCFKCYFYLLWPQKYIKADNRVI